MITVRRPSGLLVPFEVPELTLAESIARSWSVPDGGTLLRWNEPKYLPTFDSMHDYFARCYRWWTE